MQKKQPPDIDAIVRALRSGHMELESAVSLLGDACDARDGSIDIDAVIACCSEIERAWDAVGWARARLEARRAHQ